MREAGAHCTLASKFVTNVPFASGLAWRHGEDQHNDGDHIFRDIRERIHFTRETAPCFPWSFRVLYKAKRKREP